MQSQYNKDINFHDYDLVWLKKKHYRPGESRKLMPRKTGPWVVVRKMPNAVSFTIRNESNGKEEIVHHDQLTPLRNNRPDELDSDSSESSYADEDEVNSDNSDDSVVEPTNRERNDLRNFRYPRRERTQKFTLLWYSKMETTGFEPVTLCLQSIDSTN